MRVTDPVDDSPELFDLKTISERAKRSVRSIHDDTKREGCPLRGNLIPVGRKVVCDRPTLVRYLEWLLDQGRAKRPAS